jgi:predicted acylesterase/phospholipase RssA
MRNILCLSGGGSYGAFEIGIVCNLIKEAKGGWDLITGISAGSLNAAYLSTLKKYEEINHIEEIKNLWTNLNNSNIFQDEYFFNGLSIYNSDLFKKKIIEIYDGRTPVRPVIINATSLSKSSSVSFTNDDIIKYGFTDIIMSSATIPILFQPYSFLDDTFIDGGFTSNIAFYDAINYCLKNFPNESIHIDLIICGTKIPEEKVNKDNLTFKKLLEKMLGIVKEQVEYSEILKNINFDCDIDITIYEEKSDSSFSFLDFDHGAELFDSGYTFKNVETYKYKL